jgi:outer membrane protein assembly factor BamE (lipoprotein component of BamABCDE complex)
MKLSTALIALSCAGLLTGCSSPGSLTAGQSEADVRARMGTPTDTRVDPNGDRVWEYATGPEGYVTYFVRMGADGKVKDVTQVLTEDQLAKVVPGKATKTDVRSLLGRPSFENSYPVGQTWSYRYYKGGVRPGYLVVTFNPADTVTTTIAILDFTGGSRDR